MGRRLHQRIGLGAAALDSLFRHVDRHDPADDPDPGPGVPAHRRSTGLPPLMSVLEIGSLYGCVTLLVMFSGMTIAFSLGLNATVLMCLFMPPYALDTLTEKVYEDLSAITLLS